MSPSQLEAGDQRTVLSFHDSLLRTSDLATLDNGNWLNDQIISFYLEYLENNVYHRFRDEIQFLPAGVVQWMKSLAPDELHQSFGNISEQRLVFIPLNNCEISHGGGSHWSLIIYFDKRFLHLDSSPPMNKANARSFCKKLSPCFSKDPIPIDEVNCPSQTNSSDCGVYVLEFTEIACKAYARDKRLSVDVFAQVTPARIREKRRSIIRIIGELHDRPDYTHIDVGL
ncbi:sentrin-specific protease 8 [Galendromus occidentalis]|uniref:Sentrin-specific protease 8 n=1 Tax=Galendromus occidentalis TaxID=34638 RepID=A0AAJ7PB64_9ACAR|nr:sentrin-specific protease 8 [Galendromus occidentalis]